MAGLSGTSVPDHFGVQYYECHQQLGRAVAHFAIRGLTSIAQRPAQRGRVAHDRAAR